MTTATAQSPRADAVLAHLEAGKCICPFAREAARTAPVAELWSVHGVTTVCELMGAFTFDQRTAILVAAEDPPTHEASRAWAELAFGLLLFATLRINEPEVTRGLRQTVALAHRMLHDPIIHTFLHVRGRPFLTIAMGPVYRPDHPRHAPHLCVVLNWFHDIAAAHKGHPGLVKRVRAERTKTTGSLYDSDTLYLPET